MYKNYSFTAYPIMFFGLFFLINGFVLLSDHQKINEYIFKFDFKQNHHPDNYKIRFADSTTINNLYSEKNIDNIQISIQNEQNKLVYIEIKSKPINPSIVKHKNIATKIESVNFKLLDNFDFDNVSMKKQKFIKTLLPLISYENQKIIVERNKLIDLKRNLLDLKTLNNEELFYLEKIATKYKVKTKNNYKIDIIDELLIAVDIIPNSIVLAQAANESGWGSSRFAKEYNAFFGEYTYDFSKGVIPLEREKGKKHLVKSFSSYDQSVESYFQNINTHDAYKKFRSIRKLMRDKNNFSDINLLVETLSVYAADKNYIETLNSIIKTNKLNQFNKIKFTTSSS